jgi:hypothetical protein
MRDWQIMAICVAIAVLMMVISYQVSDMEGMVGQAVRERRAARERALTSGPAGTTVPASEIPSFPETTVPAGSTLPGGD